MTTLLQIRAEPLPYMHAERLCRRYMQTATVIDFNAAKTRMLRLREAALKANADENFAEHGACGQ